jgi:hypothetical protein
MSAVGLTGLEQRIADEIDHRGDELVELACALIRFDTEAREPDDPPRDEAALQEYLAGRLAARGAQIDLWEPARNDVEGSRLVPAGGSASRDARSSQLASPARAVASACC